MKLDLHVHTKTGSDGNLSLEEVFKEAKRRAIGLLSITDHDSIECQPKAVALARELSISYVVGVELNVTFQYPPDGGRTAKFISLDFLGYGFDADGPELKNKLKLMREHREARARQIMQNLNAEFDREGIPRFTEEDLKNIQATVDGAFGRPHMANYLVKKGIVKDKQEAFDKYLVRCDVPKYPLSLVEASKLIRGAGGMLAIAHPNDPNGTSLVSITRDLSEQAGIIERSMLPYIDGVECWHIRHDTMTTAHYIEFAKRHGLVMTGGSDCHQKPIVMGSLDIPEWVAESFMSSIQRRANEFKGVKA
jgi:predicted metal-dependent phosphoesterase TrpH